jgi:hypothetical protein
MNRHKTWTPEDTERLRLHIERGGSLARAAVVFKRTEASVRDHAGKHGWKFPTILQLRRRALGLQPGSRFDSQPSQRG